MEIRIKIKGDVVKFLQKSLDLKTTQIVKLSFLVLSWIVKETKKGRIIFSSDLNNEDKQRLAFPWIEKK